VLSSQSYSVCSCRPFARLDVIRQLPRVQMYVTHIVIKMNNTSHRQDDINRDGDIC
jgi:hypothetical protein